ncbi:MAG TPA: dTMP kinase [Planctomycetota bacterium]|nr:dTMP kinase [Planctomycetota bacterium]
MNPLWIDFEGIDGSGKTTVSTRVAEALRRRGIPVVHAREGGSFASPIAGRVRDLARSVDCLGLAPEAEFLLNLAREAQLVREVIRPALQRGAWVITDRTIYSHVGLARRVRGLRGDLDATARLATGGLAPHRVILIDVDPDVARWRRRIRKIRDRRLSDAGRKGLAGESLAQRTREAFLDFAARDAWTVIDNTWRTLDGAVEAVLQALDGRPAGPSPASAFEADGADLAGGYLAFADGIADRALAALLAAGLDDPRADAIRRSAPADVAAYAVSGMDAPCAWELRRRLRDDAPYYVARGLAGLPGHPQAWAFRRALESAVPDQVLHSLAGEGGDEAHALRLRHWAAWPDEAVRATRGVDDDGARAIRARARRERPGAALAESLAGLDSAEAWAMREELREAHPLAVLKGLWNVDRPEAWALRRELSGAAPKTVLGSLAGMDAPEAWEIRRALRADAPEETAASLAGLDSEEAWRWREEALGVAPVGTIKSLRGVEGARADGVVERAVAAHPRRLRVAREAVQHRTRATWTSISI